MQRCQWQSLPFLKTDLATGKSSEKNWPHKKKKKHQKFLPWKHTGKRLIVCWLCLFPFCLYFWPDIDLTPAPMGVKDIPFARLVVWFIQPPLGVDCLAAKLPTQAGQGVGWMGLKITHSMRRNDHSCWVRCHWNYSPDISDKWNPVIKVVHDGFAGNSWQSTSRLYYGKVILWVFSCIGLYRCCIDSMPYTISCLKCSFHFMSPHVSHVIHMVYAPEFICFYLIKWFSPQASFCITCRKQLHTFIIGKIIENCA